jgi:hypothetical protein
MDEEEKVTAPEGQEEEVESTDDSQASEDIRLFEEEFDEAMKEDSSKEEDDDSDEKESPSVDVKKVQDSISEVRKEQKISDFLNNPDNADYKEFFGKIRELAKKPQAKGLTIEAIANMVVPKDYWIKRGAEIAKQAEQESAESRSGGGSAREVSGGGDSSGIPDPSSLSSKEFEKKAWDIARGVRP